MRRTAVLASILILSPLATVRAQIPGPTRAELAARAIVVEAPTAPTPPSVRLEPAGRGRAALTGFVIGAALGAAAGYAGFNGFCEAVDNRCEGSRPLWMAVGALALGGLGAVIGIALD